MEAIGGKRILVVDDDPDIVDYVCTFLEDSGYDVSSAGGAVPAISELEKAIFDLVIVDVLMPGRSGLDLLVTLRRDIRWGDLPVVVLTGNDPVLEDGGRSYTGGAGIRGADEVLGKPLDTALLLSTLQRLGV